MRKIVFLVLLVVFVSSSWWLLTQQPLEAGWQSLPLARVMGKTTTSPLPVHSQPPSLVDWLLAGSFSFDYELFLSSSASGTPVQVGLLTGSGQDFALTINTIEKQLRALGNAGTSYLIDDVNHVLVTASAEAVAGFDIPVNYQAMIKTGEGVGEIMGKFLPYHEYELAGKWLKFYFEEDEVAALVIANDYSQAVLKISGAINQPSLEALTLPAENYTFL